MRKKISIASICILILIILEQIMGGKLIELFGGIGFILVDIILGGLIIGITSFVTNIKGNNKSVVICSVIFVFIYALISITFSKTELGKTYMNMLDNEIPEVEQVLEDEDEQIEIVVSDANGSSQFLVYGIYFVVAYVSGKAALKNKKETENIQERVC